MANYLLQTFASKAHEDLQSVFPTMIGFFTLIHLLFIGNHAKKVAKGDKANHSWKTPSNFFVPLKQKFAANSCLGINFLALADIRALSS